MQNIQRQEVKKARRKKKAGPFEVTTKTEKAQDDIGVGCVWILINRMW